MKIKIKKLTAKASCYSFAIAGLLLMFDISIAQAGLAPDQAHDLAVEAYIWGKPLYMSEQSRKAMTHVTRPDFKGGRFLAPMNQMSHAPALLDPSFSAVPSPNGDTLYSIAFMNLQQEPLILNIPDTKNRFYTFQFIDAYTNNFYYASQKTKGFKRQRYALVGPDWQGELAQNIEVIKSPTNTIFMIGRLLIKDPADQRAVNALQAKISLVPLSAYGSDYQPQIVPLEQLTKYRGDLAFWQELGDLMVREQPPANELDYLKKFEQIGLSAATGFDPSILSDQTKQALIGAISDGANKVKTTLEGLGNEVNGWRLMPVLNTYFGTNYMLRAALADCCLYLNDPSEAYYPPVFTDHQGQKLSGSQGDYSITFAKGQLPPVDAFWSITMYRASDRLMVKNSIDRYRIGSVNQDLKYAEDGSLTLLIQKDSPGKELESNWLPAVDDEFYMLLRLYLPQQSILSGQYVIPAVVRK